MKNFKIIPKQVAKNDTFTFTKLKEKDGIEAILDYFGLDKMCGLDIDDSTLHIWINVQEEEEAPEHDSPTTVASKILFEENIQSSHKSKGRYADLFGRHHMILSCVENWPMFATRLTRRATTIQSCY